MQQCIAIHYIVLRVQLTHVKIPNKFSGGYYEKVTPVPIPNTEVKLLSADDTWMVTSRESRSLPDLYQSPVLSSIGLCAVFYLSDRWHDENYIYTPVTYNGRQRYPPPQWLFCFAESLGGVYRFGFQAASIFPLR